MIHEPCILTDVTRCIGCEECVAACKKINGLPVEDPPPRVGRSEDGLSATRWTSILRTKQGASIRKQCRHCLEPACVSVCPVGAMQKTPEGPVIYDKSICMGCRYCMMSCPYGVPRYEWSSINPSIRKCVMCYEAIKSGRIDKPACVAACPKEATIYGEREEMIAEAHRRIDAHPERYLPRVWGEHEVGGTSVIYVSNVDLSLLAWQDLARFGDQPLPARTWHALKMVPGEFLGMGALMTGVWWVVDRRMRRAAEGGEPEEERDE